jgi:hypothetical protein
MTITPRENVRGVIQRLEDPSSVLLRTSWFPPASCSVTSSGFLGRIFASSEALLREWATFA